MTFAKQFDYIVVNDNLSIAIEEIKEIVKSYINS